MSNRVYIGYDPREAVAYRVARQSILSNANDAGVTVSALDLYYLKHLLTRSIEKKDGNMWCPISNAPMATEFAISRFCVPFLQGDGWAVFVDCDILCFSPIQNLFALADPKYAVMCVKHDYQPSETTKMDGQVQTVYPRKNWSSVVLWNCGHEAHERLTLEALNTWPGRDLHAFKWLQDDEIGALPASWNYLVDVQPKPEHIDIAHLTLGGPWLPNWQGGSMDYEWKREAELLQ